LTQYQILSQSFDKVLAIFAHPDDAEIACGGTLASFAKNGSEVHLIYLTSGDKGSFDSSLLPETVAKTRSIEFKKAAVCLGIKSVQTFNIPDGEIVESKELRFKIVESIRSIRPELVICPDPTAVFFSQSYYNHRDHRTTGFVVLDSISPEAAMPLYHKGAGDPFQVPTVFLSGSLEPDLIVDISDGIDQKIQAVLAYESRISDESNYISDVVLDMAKKDGELAKVDFGESFRKILFNSVEYRQ
jgi:LmbE family N-acetylglucosaminyl deacetylase